MTYRLDIIGEAGLQFFGKVSASISHEIKNVMAIINESAGLMEDLTVLAEKGMPIDPQRLKTHAGKIMSQIRRADGIIKNMNRFAHSADEGVKSIELGETVALVTSLSERFAAMKGITLDLKTASKGVTLRTNPFLLINLIYLCLDFAMGMVGAGKTVGLRSEEEKGGGRVRLTGLGGLVEASRDGFPGEREKALLAALKGELALNTGTGELVLTFSGEGE